MNMLGIAKEDVLKSLCRDNPWWGETHRYGGDSCTLRRAYFKPFTELALDWSIRRSTVLMGPRRVGKTVMLHQFVAHALRKNLPGSSIKFASIDTPLDRLLTLFEERTQHDPEGRRIVIFDEIQHLKDWEVHLKVLTDRHPNTRFIVSGSAAAARRLKSHESGAGRFTDSFLPPLTFAEFLAFRNLEDALIMATRRAPAVAMACMTSSASTKSSSAT